MNNSVYGKTIENLRNRIDGLLRMTFKQQQQKKKHYKMEIKTKLHVTKKYLTMI